MTAIRTIAILAAALILQACGTMQQLDTSALQAASGASYSGSTTTASTPSRPTARTGTPSATSRSSR